MKTLTEPMYYILLALTKPTHGYEIMQIVATISENRVKVGAGTLYALLTRFESESIVVKIGNDGRRKTYTLTPKGKELLDKEYMRLKASILVYDTYVSGKEA